jgi:hypothetical protein
MQHPYLSAVFAFWLGGVFDAHVMEREFVYSELWF